jgi:hypothetical protein
MRFAQIFNALRATLNGAGNACHAAPTDGARYASEESKLPVDQMAVPGTLHQALTRRIQRVEDL